MKNTFFKIALHQASRMIGKPGRLLKLVAELAVKLYRTDWAPLQLSTIRERAGVLGRMIAAYAQGHYRTVPVNTMVAMAAAVLYFINPFDLIPDAIVGIGLSDDVAVLAWVYRSATDEIKKFLTWEATRAVKA